jgi:putative NADPH-quinone reductase
MKKILIIQGHPDGGQTHFGHVIGQKYTSSAEAAGHSLRHVFVANLDFALLSSEQEFKDGPLAADIHIAQEDIRWADHVVIIYPMWLGDMPALLKGFFEQVFRPGFGATEVKSGVGFKRLLKGKSARIIVTMGMPAPVYKWFFGQHAVKNLQRNILGFCGFNPVKITLIGQVYAGNENRLYHSLSKVSRLGRNAR